MSYIETARKLRPIIEKAVQSLDDETALTVVELYPEWTKSTEYSADIKFRYGGVLYRCLTAHTSQDGWTPSAAHSLWAKVLIPDETAIPEWERPDSTNPYMKGDHVTYNGKTWKSTIDINVWSPETYGWIEVTE